MGSVSVLVGRAAHPTSKQPCAVQRARPDPRPAPAPRGRCAADRADLRHGPPDRGRPGDVVARRREASVAQAMHGGRCPLAAHPRVPPAAVGRAPHSRRRASHTGTFLARRHEWFVVACAATRGRARLPPAHPGRRRLRRACPRAARRPSTLRPPHCTSPHSLLRHRVLTTNVIERDRIESSVRGPLGAGIKGDAEAGSGRAVAGPTLGPGAQQASGCGRVRWPPQRSAQQSDIRGRNADRS